jgi:NAD(P)-dependent dehydrogenase (short-subunit alcohol dehydrogenase family)
VDLMLAGKRALVTGASKGIGLAVARALAEEGCDLVLVARNPTALEVAAKSLVENFGRDVRVIPADLAQGEGIDAVATAVDSLDVLINNAGAIPPGDLHAMDNDAWRKAWDLKLFGYVGLTRALWEKLKTRGGVVVNIIGSAGERFEPDYLAGTSANAALMAFTRALGKTAPREGMRVVGVNPGPVSTERVERFMRVKAERELGDPERWREMFSSMAFGRPAYPEEIAAAVAFLASPRSAYTSGTILTIDDPART